MKRRQVVRQLRDAAKAAGLSFSEEELTRQTGFTVGGHRSTLGRHSEIDDITRLKFFKHFEEVLGRGWWK